MTDNLFYSPIKVRKSNEFGHPFSTVEYAIVEYGMLEDKRRRFGEEMLPVLKETTRLEKRERAATRATRDTILTLSPSIGKEKIKCAKFDFKFFSHDKISF